MLDGFACSQAILSEYCGMFDLDIKTALNLSAGFAGGMRMAKTCGAVVGAIMILGLKFSGLNPEKSEDRKDVYAAVTKFIKEFVDQNGSTECKDLLAVDISTDQGLQIAKEENLFFTICPNCVKSSAAILESIIN